MMETSSKSIPYKEYLKVKASVFKDPSILLELDQAIMVKKDNTAIITLIN